MRRVPVVRPRAPEPHTITITIPEELGELVSAALAVRNAENTMDLVSASHRLYGAISGLLKKRK